MILRDRRFLGSIRLVVAASFISIIVAAVAIAADVGVSPVETRNSITVDQLLAGLVAHEDKLETISCAVGYVAKRYYADPDGKPLGRGRFEHEAIEIRTMAVANWTAAASGKSWSKRSGKTTFLRADESEMAEPFESEATFDGSLGRHVRSVTRADGIRRGTAMLSDGFVDEGPSPLEYTTHWQRLAVSHQLAGQRPSIVGTETWDNREVIVAETTPTKNGQEYKTQFWVDPTRDFIVVRRLRMVRYHDDGTWQVNEDVGSFAHHEIVPGIWLPEKFEAKVFAVPPVDTAELPFAEEVKGRFSEWHVNDPVPEGKFRLDFPPELRARGIR